MVPASVILIFLSLLPLFPNTSKCIDTIVPADLDPEEFDFTCDEATYIQHQEKIDTNRKIQEYYQYNTTVRLPLKYFIRLGFYSIFLISLAVWSYRGYAKNRKIAHDWLESFISLYTTSKSKIDEELGKIKSNNYHHYSYYSINLGSFPLVIAEFLLTWRECFWTFFARRRYLEEKDILNLSIVLDNMDPFLYSIVNGDLLKDFLDRHPEVNVLAKKHTSLDLPCGLFAYTNSLLTFDYHFNQKFLFVLREFAPYIRYIHSSDIIPATDMAFNVMDSPPESIYKGLLLSLYIPPEDKLNKLALLVSKLVSISASAGMDESVKSEINNSRSSYIKKILSHNEGLTLDGVNKKVVNKFKERYSLNAESPKNKKPSKEERSIYDKEKEKSPKQKFVIAR